MQVVVIVVDSIAKVDTTRMIATTTIIIIIIITTTIKMIAIATTVEEEISMIPGTCGQIEAVEGLLDFAQELGILRALRGKEETPFLRCHLYIKCIILPRQARDRHSET